MFVMLYVMPLIATEVTVKFTTPEPELLAVKSPVNVDENELLPAVGAVWVTVNVNVPEAAMAPFPEKNVWKLPKLEPVGVFRDVEPKPVNVIISAFPWPPRKVTEFVPLPEQPAHVNTPAVEKVIGVAETFEELNPSTRANKAAARNDPKYVGMFIPFRRSIGRRL